MKDGAPVCWLGVNNNSQVVGYVGQVKVELHRATRGPTVDLTMDPGGPSSTVLPVWIAADGTVLAGNGTAGFFIWSQGRTSRVTLATPGWKIVALSRMSGKGHITGESEETATGARRAVVLEPLP